METKEQKLDSVKSLQERIIEKQGEIDAYKAGMGATPTEEQREQLAKLYAQYAILRTCLAGPQRPKRGGDVEYR